MCLTIGVHHNWHPFDFPLSKPTKVYLRKNRGVSHELKDRLPRPPPPQPPTIIWAVAQFLMGSLRVLVHLVLICSFRNLIGTDMAPAPGARTPHPARAPDLVKLSNPKLFRLAPIALQKRSQPRGGNRPHSGRPRGGAWVLADRKIGPPYIYVSPEEGGIFKTPKWKVSQKTWVLRNSTVCILPGKPYGQVFLAVGRIWPYIVYGPLFCSTKC